MAPSEDEVSPQQGPRLFAELRTESKRFINLAPNHLGIMPRVYVSPGAAMLAIITLPDASPGDRVHVELADGGSFADSEDPGRILQVGDDRQLEIRFEASSQRGHCDLILTQGGHNRTMAIWAGPRPELASGDPVLPD